MLPKKNRLNLRKEFNWLKKEGKIIQGEFFSLLLADQPAVIKNPQPKFAFIISKKVEKKSAKRNRIKRLLREAVRHFLPQIRPTIAGAFLAKKAITDKEFSEIKNEVKNLFQKAGLFLNEKNSSLVN